MNSKGAMQFVNTLMATYLLFLPGCATTKQQDIAPQGIVFPYQWIGNIDKSGIVEPSGICFHSIRGTLFVVGDESDICEIKTDGTMLKQKRFRHTDFEGITHDPCTGLLYVGIEGMEKILEIEPNNFRVLREFAIERTLNGDMLLKTGGQGIEAITFVPDSQHLQGGTFYIANQSFSLDNIEDISAIFEIEVPVRGKGGEARKGKILRYFSPGVIDLSGLYYDGATGHLYVISDATNTILKFTKTGSVLTVNALPGENQEGITVDDNGFMYIAQDSGGIIKIKLNRKQ